MTRTFSKREPVATGRRFEREPEIDIGILEFETIAQVVAKHGWFLKARRFTPLSEERIAGLSLRWPLRVLETPDKTLGVDKGQGYRFL